jgi:phosphatidate cytidylyltransferase
MTNLSKRFFSSVILVLTLVLLILQGGVWFDILCGALFLGLISEWTKLWWQRPKSEYTITSIILIIAGLVYICFAMYQYWSLKELPHKQMMTFLIVWSTDVGAYVVGKKFGKTPLAPTISPKKTWEGFWGGILTCIVICSGVMYAQLATLAPYSDTSSWINNFFGSISLFSTLVFGIRFTFYSVAAHLGDLLESWVKRYLGVKDSGNLIPGHGGVLDRFDSFLGVCMAYYVKDILHYYGIFF